MFLSSVVRSQASSMGGGNLQKSMMARERKAKKAGRKGAGGGGAAGIAARTATRNIVCQICRVRTGRSGGRPPAGDGR